MRTSLRHQATLALDLAWRSLPQALAYEFAFKLASIALLAPGFALVVHALLWLSGHQVVANTDIAGFLLSPIGAVLALATVTLLVALTVVEFVGLVAIAGAAAERRSLGWITALRVLREHARQTLSLALRFVLRTLWMVLPSAAIVALTALLLLGEHDINYYLSERPPEFWAAVLIAGIVGAELVIRAARRMVSWSLALPLVILDGCPPAEAFRLSAEQLQTRRRDAFLLLAGTVLGSSLLSLVLIGLLVLLTTWGIDLIGERLRLVAALLGLALTVESLLLFAGSSLLAILLAQIAALFWSQTRQAEPETDPTGDPLPDRPSWRINRTGRLLAVLAIAVASVVTGLGLLSGIDSPAEVRIIAHRAGAMLGPENSLSALRASIEAGAGSAEIDVQRSADGAVVVVHDQDLMKLAGEPWRIADTGLAELQEADVGSRHGAEFAGESIATLQEFITVAGDHIELCIELKYYGPDPELAPEVIAMLRDAGLAERCELMSLNLQAVSQVRELAPEIRLGYLSAVAIGDLASLDVDFLAVADSSAHLALLSSAEARGLDVYVWTLNDAVGMSDAIDRGVDGIITDAPDLCREVIETRAALSPLERLMLRVGTLRPR